MRYRDVEKSEHFLNGVEELKNSLDEIEKIIEGAILFLESDDDVTRCMIVGSGSASNLYCLRTSNLPAFPVVNFYFTLDSRSNPNDVVILQGIFIDQE